MKEVAISGRQHLADFTTDELEGVADALDKMGAKPIARIVRTAITELHDRASVLDLLWDFVKDNLPEFEAGLSYEEREMIRGHFGIGDSDPYEDMRDLGMLDEDDDEDAWDGH